MYKRQLPSKEDAEKFLLILSPFAPHLAEELWERIGHSESLSYEPWPKFDPQALVDDEITVAIQVNGKMRGKLLISRDLGKDQVLALAKADESIQKYLDGKTMRREIYVPGRLVNLVVG